MKGVKEAFIDAGEISQMLGIGMTKAYAIINKSLTDTYFIYYQSYTHLYNGLFHIKEGGQND